MSWATSRTTISRVLKLVLKKLGCRLERPCTTCLRCMVELPGGKMKSRETRCRYRRPDRGHGFDGPRDVGELEPSWTDARKRRTPSRRWSDWAPSNTFIIRWTQRRCCSIPASRSTSTAIRGLFIQYPTHVSARSLRRGRVRALIFEGLPPPTICPKRSTWGNADRYHAVVAAAGENFAPSIIPGPSLRTWPNSSTATTTTILSLKEVRTPTPAPDGPSAGQQSPASSGRGMKLLGIDVPERM